MRVPVPDEERNLLSNQVIGNKEDAAVTTVGVVASILAYIKGALNQLAALILLHAVPSADATTNANVRDVAGNKTDAAVTSVGATKSLMGYIKALVAGSALAAGSQFTIVKTLVSSAITQAGVAVTGASSGGALRLVDVILQTNATGLAAGTNLTLEHDNGSGIAVFFSTAVSGLGANKTINLDTASVTKIRSVLESGKIITAKMTAADGTGAGTVDVYLTFQRVSAGATIAAA